MVKYRWKDENTGAIYPPGTWTGQNKGDLPPKQFGSYHQHAYDWWEHEYLFCDICGESPKELTGLTPKEKRPKLICLTIEK